MSKKSAITLQDIAKEAGVSRALVSFALNNAVQADGRKKYNVSEETEERIKEIAAKYNYRPNILARSLRVKRTSSIGVILPDISNPFFSTFARFIEDRAASRSYSAFFASTDESAARMEKAIENFVDKGIDGLIVAPCSGSEDLLRKVANNVIPVVLFDRDVEDCNVDKVLLDNSMGAQMAVRSLYGEGRRRIVMVSYSGRLSNIMDREAGYLRASAKLHIDENSYIYRADYNTCADDVGEIMRRIDFNCTDAVFFATNSLAVSGIREMLKMGVDISGKVGVATYDRGDSFDLFPYGFTSVVQPLDEFASRTFDLIVRRIEEPQAAMSKIIVSPELVKSDYYND
ncbi:MAG: LacI family transcriptional regulator [Bacteroidales bacterium]|nr:LacI family transcriptional regulator [Bacteroidales bacterium]